MTHVPIIDKWPTLAELADDLSIAYGTAKAMKRRGVIPSQYWELMIEAASRRHILEVTYEALAKAVSKKNSNSPDYLPSGEAGAQHSSAGCAPASNSDSVVAP